MPYEQEQKITTQTEPEAPPPTKPAITVNVIRDNMEAEIKFGKTSPDTLDPVPEDVLEALAESGVTKGIRENRVRELCMFPKYEQPFVVAQGKQPETGKDGFLNYLVETHRELKPAIREDGTADYKDIGFIQNVQKGQPLVEIFAPQKGEDGWDVLGGPVEGKYGRSAMNPQGANTELNEEGTLLLSAVDGNVEVRRGVVAVQEVLRVNGNVDNSTGNITFPGDVIIHGDVSSGFTVESGGSIVVRGTVEGAKLQARADITVSEGVNGMNRGSLIAGGNIKCKYMQNCIIQCEENVYADTIMYSVMECGGNVELSGKRAALIGGRSSVAGQLSAKTLGTESHAATEIHMCAASAAKNQEARDLEAQIKRLDEDLGKLAQVMARFEDLAKKGQLGPQHKDTLLAVKQNYVAINTARKGAVEQLEVVKEELLRASEENSFIRCQGKVHSGVRLSFGPLNMVVQDSFSYSRIGIIKEQIVVSPL